MLLVWVILTAAACAGKCAVDFERASFVRSGLVIGESPNTSALSDRFVWPLVVDVLADDSLRIREIGQTEQRNSAARAAGRWFEQSGHGAILSPRSGISQPGRQNDGGSPQRP